MQKATAMRLCKLAGEKIQDYVKVSQSIVYYNSLAEKSHKATQEIYVAYFNKGECVHKTFNTWATAEAFLKQLASKGASDV